MLMTGLLAAFTLVGPKDAATVAIPENAEPSTRLCVEELTNYVAKITGKVLAVKVKGAGEQLKSPAIVIGTLKTLGERVPKAAREALEKSKKFEAGWMGTDDGNLWIVGKEETADMYLAYHFLESKLGVRWFQAAIPEDPGDWYPQQKTIVIDDFAEFREPDFTRRTIGQQCTASDIIPHAGKTCGYRNGFQFGAAAYWNWKDSPKAREFHAFYDARLSKRFRGAGGHWTCYNVFRPEKYLKTDPDLFALENGVRGGGHKSTQQYCLSNRKLIDGCVKYYVDFFKKNGGIGIFEFGMADTQWGWCECEKCRALDGPGEGAATLCYSSRIQWFANQLFEGIRKECPEVKFNYEPYAVYREIPTKGTMNPDRVYCMASPHNRCYKHRFDDPKCVRNVKLFAQMLEWRKRLPYALHTYEYFTCTPPLYVCHEMMAADEIKLYKSLGMVGMYNEGMLTGSEFAKSFMPDCAEVYPSNWQWIWLTGHLLWNADQDPQALLDDAESKYYGAAYPAMKKYHALRRKLWAGRNECMGYPYGDPVRPKLLNEDGAQEKLLALLAEADKLAAYDKTLRFRLSRDRFWLNQYWIKPNEKDRYEVAHAMHVPEIKSPVVLDGDPSDKAWEDAQEVNARFLVESERENGRVPVPEHMKASVKVAMDKDNLYFLCRAEEKDMAHLTVDSVKHDDPAWRDDCFELSIFPPSVENCYYHLAINAKGVIYDSRCPGGDVSYDTGAEAKAGTWEKGWCIEVRVPAKGTSPLAVGDTWRMQIFRGRPKRERPGAISMDGTLTHDTANFVPFKLGE